MNEKGNIANSLSRTKKNACIHKCAMYEIIFLVVCRIMTLQRCPTS
jgi:hypothetical protein